MQRLTITTLLLLTFSLLSISSADAEDPEAQARRLLNALGCKGCHQFEGDGGSLAPVLDQIGSRLTKQQIQQHLAAHASTREQSFMPSYGTTPAIELKILSNFLHSH